LPLHGADVAIDTGVSKVAVSVVARLRIVPSEFDEAAPTILAVLPWTEDAWAWWLPNVMSSSEEAILRAFLHPH
jgi:hypothetical protein